MIDIENKQSARLDVRDVAIGYAQSRINSTIFKRPALFSRFGRQVGSFYNEHGRLCIAHRMLPDGNWNVLETEFRPRSIIDPHNVSVVCIDGNGFIHVAWGVHCQPLMYSRSLSPITSDDPIGFLDSELVDGFKAGVPSEIPLSHLPCTYPEFTALPNSKDLLLMFRTGRSGKGDYQLFRWSVDQTRWFALNAAVDGANPWISGDAENGEFPSTNAYPTNLAIDAGGHVHVSWTWRSGKNSKTIFKDYQSNHNLLYARSSAINSHGRLRWFDATGKEYERNGTHVIDEKNASPLLRISEGSSLINSWSLALYDRDQPAVCGWYAPNSYMGDHTRQFVLFRQDGNHWIHTHISERSNEWDGRVPEANLPDLKLSRPALLYDIDKGWIVIFADHQNGGRPCAAMSDKAGGVWNFVDLSDENLGAWEPSIDVQRWTSEGVVSFLSQPSALGYISAPIKSLDWMPNSPKW